MMTNYVVTQIKSSIGIEKRVRECLKALGLRKIGSRVTIKKQPSSDGLIRKVSHLVRYEIVE